MFLAVVFYCMLPNDVNTCQAVANTENLHPTKEQCLEDAGTMAGILAQQGLYARYMCFKMGDRA